jgi:hypothetical protein
MVSLSPTRLPVIKPKMFRLKFHPLPGWELYNRPLSRKVPMRVLKEETLTPSPKLTLHDDDLTKFNNARNFHIKLKSIKDEKIRIPHPRRIFDNLQTFENSILPKNKYTARKRFNFTIGPASNEPRTPNSIPRITNRLSEQTKLNNTISLL